LLQNKGWGVSRSPLCIALPENDGVTWKKEKTLITREGFEGNPEFSYPSIKESDDGRIHVSFTYLRQCICHIALTDKFE